MPDLSVVMCVYNGAAYLRDSLDGVLQQSLREFEFVIVDDGSDDQTSEILAAYAKSDPRIRILRRENAGVAAALARGCGAARGDLIARIDADDIPLPERFERQMAFMESRPDVGVLGTGLDVIDASGRVRTRKRPTRGHPAACWKLLFGPPVYHPTVMLRRALLEQAGGYDPAFDCAEDYELWTRLVEVTRFDNLPEVLLRYRVHEGRVTHREAETMRVVALRVRLRFMRRLLGREPAIDDLELLERSERGSRRVSPEDWQRAADFRTELYEGMLRLGLFRREESEGVVAGIDRIRRGPTPRRRLGRTDGFLRRLRGLLQGRL